MSGSSSSDITNITIAGPLSNT